MPLSTRNVVTGSNTNSFASATTRTQSYTVGSGTELLVVAVRFEGGTLNAQNVSGVRWADSGGASDEALTKVLERESSTSTGVHVSWWYLVSPTARAGLVEIDYGITSGNNNSQSWTIAEVIGGVDTAAPVGASGSASGNAGTASANAALSLTSTVAASLILSAVAHYQGNKNPYTPAAGITAELADGETGNTTDSDHSYWAGEALTTTTGSYAVGATAAASHAFAVVAFEVLPTVGGSSVAISGNAATGSVGSLGRAVSKAITGSAGTGAAGTLSVSVSKAISGNAATGAAGTLGVTGATSVALSGNSSTGDVGSLGKAARLALSGSAATGGVGALGKAVAKAISGNAGTGAVGALGRAIAKALSGNAGAGASGSLGVAGATSVAITGNAATGAIGSLAKAVSLALPGNAATGNIGIFGAAVTKALSGNDGGGTVGVFGLAIRKAIAGNSSTGAAGTLGVAGEVVLSVPGSAELTCSSAGASLTTQKATATW